MIYVLQAGDSGRFKVGYTRDAESLAERVTTLQTGCPDELRVEATWEGTRREEAALHTELSGAHIRGEWFSAPLARTPHGKRFWLATLQWNGESGPLRDHIDRFGPLFVAEFPCAPLLTS